MCVTNVYGSCLTCGVYVWCLPSKLSFPQDLSKWTHILRIQPGSGRWRGQDENAWMDRSESGCSHILKGSGESHVDICNSKFYAILIFFKKIYISQSVVWAFFGLVTIRKSNCLGKVNLYLYHLIIMLNLLQPSLSYSLSMCVCVSCTHLKSSGFYQEVLRQSSTL